MHKPLDIVGSLNRRFERWMSVRLVSMIFMNIVACTYRAEEREGTKRECACNYPIQIQFQAATSLYL